MIHPSINWNCWSIRWLLKCKGWLQAPWKILEEGLIARYRKQKLNQEYHCSSK